MSPPLADIPFPFGAQAPEQANAGLFLFWPGFRPCFSSVARPTQRLIRTHGVNLKFTWVKLETDENPAMPVLTHGWKSQEFPGSSTVMHSTKRFTGWLFAAAAAALLTILPQSAQAAAPDSSPVAPTYADLADLADSARMVIRAEVRKLAPVEPERARGVRSGWRRYYIEARTQALIRGDMSLGQSLRYLADMPSDAHGKPPAVRKKAVLLFATATQDPQGDLQLVAPDAQIIWDAATETQLRAILAELVAPDAAKKVTGVREAIYVPGNLAGEGETQFFLDTADQSAASITVQHKPGSPPAWGVSFSEVAAPVGSPPGRDTLAWYRLACFLPNALPGGVNLSDGADSRAQADADYRTVLGELGACPRSRK
jgi:hypothetical protein